MARTSKEISAMKAREDSALKALDYFLSSANKDKSTKLAATKFVLERLHPIKQVLSGDPENPLQGLLHVYIPEINGK